MVLRQGKQNIAFTQYIATVVRNNIVLVLASGIAGLFIDLTLPRHLIVSKYHALTSRPLVFISNFSICLSSENEVVFHKQNIQRLWTHSEKVPVPNLRIYYEFS